MIEWLRVGVDFLLCLSLFCDFVSVAFFFLCLWVDVFGASVDVRCHFLFIPRHTIVTGYYGFTLEVRVSVRPSVSHSRTSVRRSVRFFRFRMIT